MNDKQTLTIEAGKYYQTRSGRKAYVASSNVFTDQPKGIIPYELVGFIAGVGASMWRRDGMFFNGDTSALDIVSEWVEQQRIHGWVNIYGDLFVTDVFATREDADRSAVDGRVACVEIDVFEGHGMNVEASQ